MKLLLSDKNVKVVMINIFGGITRCDDVASGLLEAFRQIKTDIPIVIRLTGTNEKEGRACCRGATFMWPRRWVRQQRRRWHYQICNRIEKKESMSILIDKKSRLIVQGSYRP